MSENRVGTGMGEPKPEQKSAAADELPHDAAELAAGYTAQHRTYEIGGIIVSAASSCWLMWGVIKCTAPLSGWWMPLAALIGILLADFTSGFVHWMFDTWGNLDTPIFGRLAIRTFRHHHVDQKAITHHDFVETNGHNIALTTIYSICGLLTLRGDDVTMFDVFVCQSLLCATVFTAFTSQIHKWAHMEKAPAIIILLQRVRIILAPDHHAVHHSAPYSRNYCITVGWMNGPLRAIRFFETLERTITALTGVLPREDDLGKETAMEVAREIGVVDSPEPEKKYAAVSSRTED